MPISVEEIKAFKVGDKVRIQVKTHVFTGEIQEFLPDKMVMKDVDQGDGKKYGKTNVGYSLVDSIQLDKPVDQTMDIQDILMDRPPGMYDQVQETKVQNHQRTQQPRNNKYSAQKEEVESNNHYTDNRKNKQQEVTGTEQVADIVNDDWEEAKKQRQQNHVESGTAPKNQMNGFFDTLSTFKYRNKK